uniref:Uncharacterized protein n=1 Tax=Romanomermis culicivorax TaxID=13658 RepID=A0A915INR8_ROMCU
MLRRATLKKAQGNESSRQQGAEKAPGTMENGDMDFGGHIHYTYHSILMKAEVPKFFSDFDERDEPKKGDRY